jgi:PDZ domain-containing protein
MTPRGRTLLTAWAGVAVLTLLMFFLPVPYVVLTPTTPTNTLGADPNSTATPVLRVHGPSYPTSGKLQLTTVGVVDQVSLGVALLRWVQHRYAVVPRSVVYPPDKPKSEVDKENVKEMADSRSSALVAALRELDYPDTIVGDFSAGSKAKGVIDVGDRIVGLDGKPVVKLSDIRDGIAAKKPGETVVVVVERGGRKLTRKVELTSGTTDGVTKTLLGIAPVSVDITLADVSGPSAGLMFSLGIIDKLTPGFLTGGKNIAGTGTIDVDGTVGSIGGVQQKLFGARDAGAGWFLVPAANCAEARAADVPGLVLVKVPGRQGLHQARLDVEQIAAGNTPASRC